MRIRVSCIGIVIGAALLLPLSTGRRAETVDFAPTLTTQDQRIVADKYVVAVGETVTFHIEPMPSISSPYLYVYDFGDRSRKENHKDKDFVQHRFKSPETFSVAIAIETPPNVAPNEALGPPTPTSIQVRQVQVSADPLAVEVGIPVTVTATSASKDPNLRYRFSFGDNQQTSQWQESNTAVHAYSAPDKYRARVEVGFAERSGIASVDSNDSQLISVARPPPGALVFHVDRARVNAGEQITLSAEFPANGRHIQYRFIFGDGTPTRWQDEAKVAHTYQDVRTYHPYVEVGVLLDRTPATLLASRRETVEVVAAQSTVASPTRTNSPEPPSTQTDWNRFLIPILIGLVAVLVLVILTAGLIGTYKAVKWAFASEPTFVPHIDTGTAGIAQGSAMPVIQFELHLDPNVGDGFYDIITTEPSLIGAERSHA